MQSYHCAAPAALYNFVIGLHHLKFINVFTLMFPERFIIRRREAGKFFKLCR